MEDELNQQLQFDKKFAKPAPHDLESNSILNIHFSCRYQIECCSHTERRDATPKEERDRENQGIEFGGQHERLWWVRWVVERNERERCIGSIGAPIAKEGGDGVGSWISYACSRGQIQTESSTSRVDEGRSNWKNERKWGSLKGIGGTSKETHRVGDWSWEECCSRKRETRGKKQEGCRGLQDGDGETHREKETRRWIVEIETRRTHQTNQRAREVAS